MHLLSRRHFVAVLFLLICPLGARAQGPEAFRPPAAPLVTHDPYFSVWSMSDNLTDDWSRHWTGAVHAMSGIVRIDGKPYRFLGPQPAAIPAMRQISVQVLPTRTLYRFEAGGVRLVLTFLTPALPHDLALLSRPVTYLTWDAQARDGKRHSVSLYFDATAEWAVNQPQQRVVWSRPVVAGMDVLRVGTEEQPILAKKGDNLRIDWGWFHLAVPRQGAGLTAIASADSSRDTFAATGGLPARDETRMPRPANDEWPVLACTFDLGQVGDRIVSRHVLLAYDDLFSIELMQKRLRPYWRAKGMDLPDLLRAAERDYSSLTRRCAAFDAELMADLARVGGIRYAELGALAFRQCLAAHKLVADEKGTPLYFSKENFSNGSIATVDVTYPSSPFFLVFNPTLLKGQLIPILDYARSGRWKFPFAPHDLGTYPLANGQTYGGGETSEENQMPVEESGNLLLMAAAIARGEGKPDFALRYWPLLTQWANYLRDKGMDPENQLSTDDFAGHLAHNTNLSLKAILALGGYARLCEMAGKREDARTYRRIAEEMAAKWAEMARDGDHYRLAFDKPGTWSQKYNLVWDRLLGLNLFPREIARTEVAFYLKKQNEFGLPLDNRRDYTKSDWLVWSATLAENRRDFDALLLPLYRFADLSPSRVPFTDWYDTKTGRQVGFQARSVIGGIFIKLLTDPARAKKWAARAK